MLVECSPAIVAQINLVNNFTGTGVVKSFYVPYFCPECDEEKVLLVEASDMGPPPHEPPTCRCDECDLVMDFDDMPDSYFAFLSNQRKLAEPDEINGAMKDSRAARSSAQAQGEVAREPAEMPPAQTPSRACRRSRRPARAPSQIGMGAALPGTPPGRAAAEPPGRRARAPSRRRRRDVSGWSRRRSARTCSPSSAAAWCHVVARDRRGDRVLGVAVLRSRHADGGPRERNRVLAGERISRAAIAAAATAGSATPDAIRAAVAACDHERAAVLAFARARGGEPVELDDAIGDPARPRAVRRSRAR